MCALCDLSSSRARGRLVVCVCPVSDRVLCVCPVCCVRLRESGAVLYLGDQLHQSVGRLTFLLNAQQRQTHASIFIFPSFLCPGIPLIVLLLIFCFPVPVSFYFFFSPYYRLSRAVSHLCLLLTILSAQVSLVYLPLTSSASLSLSLSVPLCLAPLLTFVSLGTWGPER